MKERNFNPCEIGKIQAITEKCPVIMVTMRIEINWELIYSPVQGQLSYAEYTDRTLSVGR